jgi:hypothetical protein
MESKRMYGTGVKFIARLWLGMAVLFGFLHLQANCNPSLRKKAAEKEQSISVVCLNHHQVTSETNKFLSNYQGVYPENIFYIGYPEESICCPTKNFRGSVLRDSGRLLRPAIQIGAP